MVSIQISAGFQYRTAHAVLVTLVIIISNVSCSSGMNSGNTMKDAPSNTVTALAKSPSRIRAAADIGLLAEGGRSTNYLKTPKHFKAGDPLVTYEGPGWESDKIAYRLYLDGRNAIDIFGKRQPESILHRVGRGEDYHTMAHWGMDILKVGHSLGAGGFGILANGEAKQIGPARYFSAEIIENTADRATVRVIHEQSLACGDDIAATYTIDAGERLTRIQVKGACRHAFVAGLVIHPETIRLASTVSSGEWQYVARYGKQTLLSDNLGMALFFKRSTVASLEQDGNDDFIVFKSGKSATYMTGSAWEQEKGGLRTLDAFESWLKTTQTKLNHTQ